MPEKRMKTALGYLGHYYNRKGYPSIILLNEMLGSDLAQIQDEDWAQQNYYITDITS